MIFVWFTKDAHKICPPWTAITKQKTGTQSEVFSDGVARDTLIARGRLLLQGRILPRDVGRLGPRTGQEVLHDLELVGQ